MLATLRMLPTFCSAYRAWYLEDGERIWFFERYSSVADDDCAQVDAFTLATIVACIRAIVGPGWRPQQMRAPIRARTAIDGIDAWARRSGKAGEVGAPERFDPTQVDDSPCLGLDLRSGEIRTVVWATGFRADYSWLDVPVFDRKGRIRHDGGVVEAPGIYVMGLPFLRRRKSSFLDGVGPDAVEITAHLVGHLDLAATAH